METSRTTQEIIRDSIQTQVYEVLNILYPIRTVIVDDNPEVNNPEEVMRNLEEVITQSGEQFVKDVIAAMRHINTMADRYERSGEPSSELKCDEKMRAIIWACQKFYRDKMYEEKDKALRENVA